MDRAKYPGNLEEKLLEAENVLGFGMITLNKEPGLQWNGLAQSMIALA